MRVAECPGGRAGEGAREGGGRSFHTRQALCTADTAGLRLATLLTCDWEECECGGVKAIQCEGLSEEQGSVPRAATGFE